MPDRSPIRIFISSPSDVRAERLKAEQIIARLDREFAYHLRVEAVLWEREPLVATHAFQDERNIPRASGADIVVVILWSRLGVLLPEAQFRGLISGRPVTGTEWEFEDALASARERGVPDLLLYRKTAKVTVELDDEAALAERQLQRALVQDFIGRWFLTEDGEGYTAASHSFATVTEFEEQLYEHLRDLLERRAGAHAEGVAIRWHQSPFRGLLPFEYEHAPVFFGRTRARNELRELLARQAARGHAFVLVLGASGSGKSSLVKAGLLPDLMLPGMIGRVALVRYAQFRPSDRPQDPVAGIAAALLARTALPELAGQRYTPERLSSLLHQAPVQAIVPIEDAMAQAAEVATLAEIAQARLLLIVDQLEELFASDRLNSAERDAFVAVLGALAESGLVWVVATMRSDFYDRLEQVPALARLAADEACYRLLPPDSAEIGRIICQPAREAGLSFAFDERRGIGLDEVIGKSAGSDRGALPLLSFLLDQLWQRRTPQGELTFAAYDALGGLEGALGRRAEEVFTAMPDTVQAALPRVLRALVTAGQGADGAITSRPALRENFPEDGPERRLIDAFLAAEARLLVGDENEAGRPRIRVAHEALLTHWHRASRLLAEDAVNLARLRRLEEAERRWRTAKREDRQGLLARPGLELNEARALLTAWPNELGPGLRDYIAKSREAERRRERFRRGTFGAAVAAAVVFALVAVLAGLFWRHAEEQKLAAVDNLNAAIEISDYAVSILRTEVLNRNRLVISEKGNPSLYYSVLDASTKIVKKYSYARLSSKSLATLSEMINVLVDSYGQMTVMATEPFMQIAMPARTIAGSWAQPSMSYEGIANLPAVFFADWSLTGFKFNEERDEPRPNMKEKSLSRVANLLEIRARIIVRCPDNVQLQHDMAIRHERLGDLFISHPSDLRTSGVIHLDDVPGVIRREPPIVVPVGTQDARQAAAEFGKEIDILQGLARRVSVPISRLAPQDCGEDGNKRFENFAFWQKELAIAHYKLAAAALFAQRSPTPQPSTSHSEACAEAQTALSTAKKVGSRFVVDPMGLQERDGILRDFFAEAKNPSPFVALTQVACQ